MFSRTDRRVPSARVARDLPLSAERAWELVADARHHARWVPLTRVGIARRVTEDVPTHRAPDGPEPGWAWCGGQDEPQAGDLVVAVSGFGARAGARGLVDRMRIERYEPPLDAVPGTAVFVKIGPLLSGTARIVVTADGPGRSQVSWSEEVHLRGLPPVWTEWAGAVILHAMLVLTLRRIQRDARRATHR